MPDMTTVPKAAHWELPGEGLRHDDPLLLCLELLTKAKDMVEIDVRNDPHYHIADNKLG